MASSSISLRSKPSSKPQWTLQRSHAEHHERYSVADDLSPPIRRLHEATQEDQAPRGATVKGKAAAIVQDAEAYQQRLELAATASAEEGIRQGLEDVKQGKVRPAREFLADFEAEHGIPG